MKRTRSAASPEHITIEDFWSHAPPESMFQLNFRKQQPSAATNGMMCTGLTVIPMPLAANDLKGADQREITET